VLRGEVELPTTAALTLWGFRRTEIALSPDGTALVWSGSPDGTPEKASLYRRQLDEAEATRIPGTEGASQPFFSPDGQWLGFYDSGSAKLCKIPSAGGLAVDLVAWRPAFYGPMGAVWTQEGKIILGTEDEGLVWIPAEGGRPQPITTMDPERETGHRLPHLLPGGEALLFTVMPHLWGVRARVEAVDLRTGERRVVVEDAADGRYVPSGHLVFLRQGLMMAAPFDPEKLRLEGPPVPVLDGVRQSLNLGDSSWNSGAGQYAVADSGLMIFASGGIYDDPPAELVLVDQSGRVEPLRGFDKPLATSQARFSPDGRQIVFVEKARSGLLWLFDIERQTQRSLSTEGIAGYPVWRPDGRQVVVGWSAAGPPGLWLVPTGEVGPWQALELPGAESLPPTWSPHGQWLAFVRRNADGSDIFLYDFEDRETVPFLATPAEELSPEISPDGRWMAFVSDESGRREVYVASFPEPGRTFVLSSEAAAAPAWSEDGRTVFYYAFEERELRAVDFGPADGRDLGRPEVVLELEPDLVAYYPAYRGYDIHPDGSRFLVERRTSRPSLSPMLRLHLIDNWFAELERLSPTE
jgi:serine/threonine-protein kinase